MIAYLEILTHKLKGPLLAPLYLAAAKKSPAGEGGAQSLAVRPAGLPSFDDRLPTAS